MMAALLDIQQLPAYAPAVVCACARIMVSWVMRAAVAFAVLLALASPPVRAQVALYDSLLHEAAATGDIELTRYLLDGGAAVDARAALDGVTPLHSAARSGEAEVARLLLARGAAVGARAVGYHTPLHMAAVGGHGAMAELLLAHGAEVEALSSGGTPLHLAALEGHAALAELLLAHGAEVNARGGGGYDQIPLMMAARNGHAAVAVVLLRHGAVVAARDNEGMTALAQARALGRDEVVDLLRRQGAQE